MKVLTEYEFTDLSEEVENDRMTWMSTILDKATAYLADDEPSIDDYYNF